MRPLVLLVALSLYAAPAAAEITLSAPASVPAGAPYPVTWSGDGNPRDFITLVPVGTAEGKYEAYTYANQPTVELLAPDDPGDYELRYLDNASPYATRARLAVTVTPVTATLTVAPTAEGGSQISVAWTGPDNARDFITIVPADTPERTYKDYVYTSKGSPVTLRAPDAPGDYEIRYLTAQKYYTLASAPVRVGGAEATLSGPSRVDAGQTFNVQWTGPDNDLDWIGLFPAGAENNAYAMYRYTKAGNPAELRAPDNPGSYEARYLTAQNTVLGTLAVEVGAVSASVSAPAEVVGGAWFEFSWTGPDNPGDYIGMVAAGAGDRARHAVYAYTKKGNPGSMAAPLEPGDYELRYETGQSGSVLASTPIRVTPPTTAPGTVVVAFAQSAGLSANDGVEIILDASGSMLKKQEGKRRIDIAKDVLLNLAGADIPAGTPFALRVFGHKEKDSCRTDLEIALAPLDVARVTATIQAIEAMNLAKTPIAASLDLVRSDLAGVRGERVVVLITDGEETCGGDPAAVVETLRSEGLNVRINVVGFAIDDADLKAAFRYWADLGGGEFYDTANAGELGASMRAALKTRFALVNAAGAVVAEGTVGGEAVSTPPGSYTLRAGAREVPVTVESGKESRVTVDR